MPTGIYQRKPHTKERKENIRKALKGKKRPLFSEIWRKNMGKAMKGRKSWNKNKKTGIVPKSVFKRGQIPWNKGKKLSPHSEITRSKMSEWHIENPNRKFKDTGIELKIEAELQKRSINYQKQVPLCKVAIVDFYLPEYRIVIQCDGDYWHNLSGSKERSEKQDKVLTFNGFNVYRFWEHEINRSAKNCIDKLFN